jgi:hypothetical protein
MRALLRIVAVSGETKVRAARGTDGEWPKGIAGRSPSVVAAAAATTTTKASKGLHAPFSTKCPRARRLGILACRQHKRVEIHVVGRNEQRCRRA